MRDALPKALVALLTLVLASGVVRPLVRRARLPRAATTTPPPSTPDRVRGVVVRSAVVDRRQAATPAELRGRVANLAAGTYVADVLAEQDSALYRWPERLSDAVRVFVEPASGVADWSPRYPEMARHVFDEWAVAGFPLRFTFVYDSAGADIAIRWVDRFPSGAGQRIGETERVQTSTFLIARASILVANHDSAGRAMSPEAVAGVVRHEVGHALGLNHARDTTSVMYRASATSTISPSDRATLRLIYLVPGGSLR